MTPSTGGVTDLDDLLRPLVAVRRMANAALVPLRVCARDASGVARVPDGFGQLFARACAGLGIEGLQLVDAPPAGLDSFEQIVERQLGLWKGTGAAFAEAPGLEAAIARADAASSRALFSAGTITAPDGAHLNVYSHGPHDGEPVVLIQALGMPIELAHDLLLHVGDRARVVTWEVRGEFHLEDDFDALEKDLDAEIADLLLVMDHFGLRRAHLLAFCIAAPLAMRAATLHPERFASLSVVNGGFGLTEARTDYEQQFHTVFPKVGASRPAAQLFFKLFKGGGGASASSGIAIDDPQAHIVYLPYVHPERLYRYGRLVTPLLKSAVLDWVGELRTPTLLVATDRDPVSHPKAARIVAERIAGAQLALLAGDRHLGLMNRPGELGAVWLPFVAAHPA